MELKRAPFKSFHAIYVIKADSEILDKLFEDFKDEGDALYSKIHLYFLTKASKKILVKLSQNKNVMKRLLSCKEIYHDFELYEYNMFTLNNSDYSRIVYTQYGAKHEIKIRKEFA